MLAVAIGGVSYYAVRKTGEFDIGVKDHVHCAIAGTYPRQTQRAEMAAGLGTQFAPMLQPLLNAAGAGYTAVSAHHCTVAARTYVHVILQKGQTPVSVILTRREDRDVFPRALSSLHEGSRVGYSVAAFDSGPYLAYIVSALPDRQNHELAGRLAPMIDPFTKM